MTGPRNPRPTDDQPTTDPGAIDLEVLQARCKLLEGQLSVADIDRLIAAVEALRDRVASFEAFHVDDNCKTKGGCLWIRMDAHVTDETERADAAEARERARDEAWPKLLDVLETVAPYFEGEHHYDHPDNVKIRAARKALAALDALPPEDVT